jgi:hypothetical protein
MLNILSHAHGHKWRFYRAGGFDQVSLETGADLMALDQLDQKLWVALACPAKGLEFDTKTPGVYRFRQGWPHPGARDHRGGEMGCGDAEESGRPY